jgi:phosphatidylserine/phosphatidylglycerophosphate/cardiolipin synthase-like enzyme
MSPRTIATISYCKTRQKQQVPRPHGKKTTFGEFPVVMTASHNMGPKASADNDENLVIIENNRKLAIEYAVHIKSLYDHYRWRFRLIWEI